MPALHVSIPRLPIFCALHLELRRSSRASRLVLLDDLAKKKTADRNQYGQPCNQAEVRNGCQAPLDAPLAPDRTTALQQLKFGQHRFAIHIALARVRGAGAVKDGVEFEQVL